MITPTIGRVVWYHKPGSTLEQQPNAAIISYVLSDSWVNLVVFDEYGVAHGESNVRLFQGGDEVRPSGHYCEWMPYQIGQAKKHAEKEGN